MARTLAELLINIKTGGTQQVKKDLADIEAQLKRIDEQSAKSIRAFNQTQQRLLQGQKQLMTSGIGKGVSPIGIESKDIDEITQALKDMAGPLNAVIDGVTQFAQILTLGSSRAQTRLRELRADITNIRQQTSPRTMERALRLSRDMEETNPLFGMTMRGAGFETRFQYQKALDNALQYERLARQITAAERQALPIHERFWSALVTGISGLSVGGALMTGAAAGFALIIAGLATATVKMYEFMFASRQAGREYQSMSTRLKAMALGDRSMSGRGVMADITGSSVSDLMLARQQAGPSRFTTKQMTDQIVQLRAFGLNAGRILPLIAKVGQAFGAGDQELGMYTNAFGQLAGGQMPDVQVLNRMGISKQMLKKQGVQFKGSELISSTETVMVAMEKIINGKFGKIFDLTKNDAESMSASVQDAFDGIQQKVGLATENGLIPFYQALQSILGTIEQGSFADAFARDLVQPITDLGNTMLTFKDLFIGLVAGVSAGVATLVHSLTRLPRGFGKLFGGNTVKERLGGLWDIVQAPTPLAIGDDLAYFTSKTQEYLWRMADVNTSGVRDTSKKPFGGIPPFGGSDDKDKKDKTKKTLEKIEQNTRKSAELLDLRRQTMGGGEIAALGVTGAEISGMGLRYRSEISLRSPIRPDTDIVRGIKNLVGGNLNYALQGSPINRVRY